MPGNSRSLYENSTVVLSKGPKKSVRDDKDWYEYATVDQWEQVIVTSVQIYQRRKLSTANDLLSATGMQGKPTLCTFRLNLIWDQICFIYLNFPVMVVPQFTIVFQVDKWGSLVMWWERRVGKFKVKPSIYHKIPL